MSTPIRKALAGAALISACAVSFAAAQNAGSTDGDTGAQAGTPLQPGDAAGAWTLQSKGGAVCAVTLSAKARAGGTFDADVGPACLDAYAMRSVTGWRPSRDGLALTDGSGGTVVGFNRWSNSLFVSHRASGEDLQLSRGAPPPHAGP